MNSLHFNVTFKIPWCLFTIFCGAETSITIPVHKQGNLDDMPRTAKSNQAWALGSSLPPFLLFWLHGACSEIVISQTLGYYYHSFALRTKTNHSIFLSSSTFPWATPNTLKISFNAF
jgi:hypothetical protein